MSRRMFHATISLALMSATLPVLAERVGSPATPLVRVHEGSLAGSSDGGINRFLGIPYAAPPVGPLRWREPQPAAVWRGTRAATGFGASCPQMKRAPLPSSREGSQAPAVAEDCLYLNIWAPAQVRKPLPVMVWIHGGGFNFGTSSEPAFDGTAFARKGVVLVTINYRLGPFGFLAHPDLTKESRHHASGNYGMLDQIAALKWVRANIGKFGGDPRLVTIFGESAGSTAVSILAATPLARGLFQRAIGESTSQFDPAGGLTGRKDLRAAEIYGAEFGRSLGAGSATELRALSVEQILERPTFFWPIERDNYLLPDLVHNIFAQGKQNDVPTMVGSNSDEGSVLKMPWVKPDASEQQTFDRFYAGLGEPLRQSSTDAVQWQMRRWASLQARTGKAKAWLYWFDRATPGREAMGAFHGAEIVYVFQTLGSQKLPWTRDDYKLSSLMADYWVNFARKGDPNGAGLPAWPSYDEAAPALMQLSPDARVVSTPRAEVQDFLDAYFDKRR